MAENPRKVGVYGSDGSKPGMMAGVAGYMNFWTIALVVLAIILALYFFL